MSAGFSRVAPKGTAVMQESLLLLCSTLYNFHNDSLVAHDPFKEKEVVIDHVLLNVSNPLGSTMGGFGLIWVGLFWVSCFHFCVSDDAYEGGLLPTPTRKL